MVGATVVVVGATVVVVVGASVVVVLGLLFLGEPANLLRVTGIVVVLGGVLMLRLAEG